MIPLSIHKALDGNELPDTFEELKAELCAAEKAGNKIPKINFEKGIYTKEQAEKKLTDLGVSNNSLFYEVFCNYRFFPSGNGEELHNLHSIEGEYDGFLQLSSPEGEGSYFYSIESDEVFDVEWGEEEELITNQLEPKWASFSEFLIWYYE